MTMKTLLKNDLSLLRRLKKFADRAIQYSKRGIPGMLPKLGDTLGAMYSIKSGGDYLEGVKAP
jgi:hypothetical protein